MTVFGRFGALFLVLSGAGLLFMNGLHSPLDIWYIGASILAGTAMVAYVVISPPSTRCPQPTFEPTSPSTSDESTTSATARSTDSHLTHSKQTTESTESTDQKSEPASDDDPNPNDSPSSDEQPHPPLTTVKKLRRLPPTTPTTKQTTPHTETARKKQPVRTTTRRKQYVTTTASPRENPARANNPNFTPVETSRETKLAQVDTKFSYLDVDLAPELISLDPIPDLIEVDVGPSAVSQDLVRSPVEVKISSFLKALLTPTPRSSGTTTSDDSTRPSSATTIHTRQRTDEARTGGRPADRDTRETPHREPDRFADRSSDPLTAVDGRQQPVGIRPQSSGQEPENHRQSTTDTAGYRGREDVAVAGTGRYSDRRSLGWEPVIGEEPIRMQEAETVDVEMDYSPPRWDPAQWDADPFGLDDFGPGFSESGEPVADSVEQPDLGFRMSDWEADVSIKEPTMERKSGMEIFGLDRFPEPPGEAVGLPGLTAESKANPLPPVTDSPFPDEDVEEDWLTF